MPDEPTYGAGQVSCESPAVVIAEDRNNRGSVARWFADDRKKA
jgi:hypothetical protein